MSRRKSFHSLPGFPAAPFATKADAYAHFQADRITCLECGRTYKSLCGHIVKHTMTETDYKQKFGIPYNQGLIGSATWDKYHALMDTPEQRAFMLEVANRNRTKKRMRRPLVSTVLSYYIEQLRTHPGTRKAKRIPFECKNCGKAGAAKPSQPGHFCTHKCYQAYYDMIGSKVSVKGKNVNHVG